MKEKKTLLLYVSFKLLVVCTFLKMSDVNGQMTICSNTILVRQQNCSGLDSPRRLMTLLMALCSTLLQMTKEIRIEQTHNLRACHKNCYEAGLLIFIHKLEEEKKYCTEWWQSHVPVFQERSVNLFHRRSYKMVTDSMKF